MTPDTSKQLSLPGMSLPELKQLEAEIHAGMKGFMKVGHALQKIEKQRGYLLKNYKSFGDYCEGEFHFSLRHGERLMLAAQTAETVKRVTGQVPQNEAVARVLTTVAKDESTLKKVAAQLKTKGQSITTATAEKVAEVVERVQGKAKSNGRDAAGKPSPIEKATAPLLGALSDACPGCKAVPTAYQHTVGGWECADCHTAVRVNAAPLEIAVCKECGKPVAGEYCTNCGAIQ